MTEDHHHVFISYSRKDEHIVLPMVEWLKAQGVSVFFDQSGIAGAENFADVLATRIEKCKTLVLFLSKSSADSEWVQREVFYAFNQKRAVLPLVIEPVQLGGALAIQLAPINQLFLHEGEAEHHQDSIVRALQAAGVHIGDEQPMPEVPRSTAGTWWPWLVSGAILLVAMAAGGFWLWGTGTGSGGDKEQDAFAAGDSATPTPFDPHNEFLVNTAAEGAQDNPALATCEDGSFVVAWDSQFQDGSAHGIFAKWYNADGTLLTDEVQANSYTQGVQQYPAVGTLADCSAVVLWESQHQDGSAHGIFAQLFDKAGKKVRSEFRVNQSTPGSQRQPRVDTFPDGGCVVVWYGAGPDEASGIFGQVLTNDGTRSGGEYRVNGRTSGTQSYADVAVLSKEHMAVVWDSEVGGESHWDVMGRIVDRSGKHISDEFLVNDHTRSFQRWPRVSPLGDGGFAVSWTSHEQDGAGMAVVARLFDPKGQPRSNEFLVNTRTQGNQAAPLPVGLSHGGFAIAWMDEGHDQSGHCVKAAFFYKDGTRIDEEIQVNSFEAGDQLLRAVAPLTDGRFLAAWASAEQDGSGTAVIARIVGRKSE